VQTVRCKRSEENRGPAKHQAAIINI
jgi:hypothetical protein